MEKRIKEKTPKQIKIIDLIKESISFIDDEGIYRWKERWLYTEMSSREALHDLETVLCYIEEDTEEELERFEEEVAKANSRLKAFITLNSIAKNHIKQVRNLILDARRGTFKP